MTNINQTPFTAVLGTVTIEGKEVKGFIVPNTVVARHDLGRFFPMVSNDIHQIVFTQTANVYVQSGKEVGKFSAAVGTEYDDIQNFKTFQFFCHIALNSAIKIGSTMQKNELELLDLLEAEVEEEEAEVAVSVDAQIPAVEEAVVVVPEVVVSEVPAIDETPVAVVTPAVQNKTKEESVPMTTPKAINLSNSKFTTLLQTGPATIKNSKSLRLKAADKSPQTLSMQAAVSDVQGFVVVDGKLEAINMSSIFDPEAFAENQAMGLVTGLDANAYKVIRTKEFKNVDGTSTAVQTPGFSDEVIFVATENNLVEMMKIKENETAFITSNESAQSRIASRGKLASVEVYNTQGEVVRLQVQDATNLAVLNFNGVDSEMLMNHLFTNGLYFRTRTASEKVSELVSMTDLVKFSASNDTPSQKRQAKVTFIANSKEFNVYDFIKGMGNVLIAYSKKQNLEVNGTVREFYSFDIQKNSTRLGLLGSASKELKEFPKVFGKFASKADLGNGNEEFTTTTGLRILLCEDVKGLTKQSAKVFNSNIDKVNPGHSDARPSITTGPDFEWEVNLTDGGIIADADFMQPMLEKEKLVGRVRNGKLRGYAHQFRMNFQVKGLNVIASGIKAMTGYDMVIFDGARKTNLLELLQEGRDLECHIMLTASVFKDTNVSRISAQAMNNLNIHSELALSIAKENFAKAELALSDVSLRDAAYALMHDGKEMQDVRNVLSKGFNMQKFYGAHPRVWEDVAAKLEIQAEIIDFIKTHKDGYLYVAGKNNYMFTDLYAIIKAVQDGTYMVKRENIAAEEGQVILPMITAEGTRYFYEGETMSIRSPHVQNDETQFATAINPLKSNNEELVGYWNEWLLAGHLDGITFFSAVDIMVPASSGADFDGDTSLMIIEKRIIDAVKRSPQYLNFYVKYTQQGASEWAYEYSADGILLGGWTHEGELVTEAGKAQIEKEGVQCVLTQDSSILGDGCPWKNPAPAPAFDLPEGVFQKNYTIYIPAEMIDSAEAYKAWVDSIHIAIRAGIASSDIGAMSNVTMAITNGMNYVQLQIEKAVSENRSTGEIKNLSIELKYLNDMLDVFTPVVWYSIDAAKHGGAYKDILVNWMQWATSKKEMKKELSAGLKSMKRIIGYAPKDIDARTREARTSKISLILPNVIREAKFKFGTAKGRNMDTNLQTYANGVTAVYEEAMAARNDIPVIGNNLLDIAYGITYGTTFNSGQAKQIYTYFAEAFEKENKKYEDAMYKMRLATDELLAQGDTDFQSMNSAKQTAMVKRFHPQYNSVKTQQKSLLFRTRQQLRNELNKRNMDIATFAAASYIFAYETAMDLEKRNAKSKSGSKAPVYILWKLLEEELLFMFSSIDGARIAPMTKANQIFSITSLYFVPTEEFKAKASSSEKASNEIVNHEIAISASATGMGVYLVEAGKDVTPANLIGDCRGYAAYKFVPNFSYRIHQSKVKNVNTSGITLDLGDVFMYGNKYEGLQSVTAKAFYDRTAQAKLVLAVELSKNAQMSDLVDQQFVSLVKGDTAFFGIKEDGKIRLVATTKATTGMEEGTIYNVDMEFSEFDGALKGYVYGATKTTTK